MGVLLAVLAAADALGPWGLLALTFAIGTGTAMNFPAWAATTPELVPREDLVGAIALNGIGFNLARALGPALGGFVIAASGPAAAFALNALAFLALIGALVAWRRPAAARAACRASACSAPCARGCASSPPRRPCARPSCAPAPSSSSPPPSGPCCRWWCASGWSWDRRPSA